MNTAKGHTSLFAAIVSIAVVGFPAAAPGFAGAGVDVAFVAPDGSVAVAGTMVEARVLAAIRSASESTGVAFPYLLAKASRESGFDVSADAASSSASGMFQFTRQTWLDLFSRHGSAYGRGDLAGMIVRSPRGGLIPPEGEAGRRILDLRHDPELAAHLAAEYTRENRATLSRALGRKVSPEELYIAHFLGAQGALHDRLVRAFKREMVRFASLSPEMVGRPRAASPRQPARKSPARKRLPAEDLQVALARHLLPGGGLALPWLDGALDGAEPVRLPVGPAMREAAVRGVLGGGSVADDEAPVLVQVLPPSAARAAMIGTRAAFSRVPADRAEGALHRPPGAARFAAPMPPRPAGDGAKVAGGALPRYEKTTPEVADAAPREARPGV